jgi:hypothetical protein
MVLKTVASKKKFLATPWNSCCLLWLLLCLWWSLPAGGSVTHWGYSVVRLDPATGAVIWRVGGDFGNPALRFDGTSLIVVSQERDGREMVLDLDPASGRAKPPAQVPQGCLARLEALGGSECAALEVGNPQEHEAAKCEPTCRRIEVNKEPHGIGRLDPLTCKLRWQIDLVGGTAITVGQIHVRNLPQGDLLVAVEPLRSVRTEKNIKWLIKTPSPSKGAEEVSCTMVRVSDEGSITWKVSPKVQRLEGAYSRGFDAYRWADSVIVRCMDWLYRIDLATGHLLWEFDMGYSVNNEPIGDGYYLFVVQREAPKCREWDIVERGSLCPL